VRKKRGGERKEGEEGRKEESCRGMIVRFPNEETDSIKQGMKGHHK
jgi:hypothetical protein